MLRKLDLTMGSCFQCPYLRYDEVESDEVDMKGWICEHPDIEGTIICNDEQFDTFHEMYPTGFHKDCPLDNAEGEV